jgi:phosphate uptake regulator
MKRKLIKQGLRSVTVSLPNKWVERFGLKPKDEIELVEQGNKLILNSNSEAHNKKASLHIEGLPKAIVHRYLVSAYKKGCDEIELHFSPEIPSLRQKKKLNAMEYIQEVVNQRLIGVEIVEQSNKRCLIKQISKISTEDFNIILKRIFYLTLALSEAALDCVANKRLNYFLIKNQHDNIEKFVNYAIRILNKRGLDHKTATYFYLLTELEEISDTYTYIVRDYVLENRKVHDKAINVFEQINEAFRTFYEFFYSFDPKKAVKILENRRSMFDKINLMIKTEGIDSNLLLSRLAVVAIRVQNLVEARVGME